MKRLLCVLVLLWGMLVPHISQAAIAFVASVSGGSTNGNTFTTSSFDSTGANFIVCGLVSYGGATEPVVTDSKGNIPDVTSIPAQTSSGTRTHIIFFTNPTVGAGHTFTVTGTTVYPSIACEAFSGAATVSPVDASNGIQGGPATSIATGSVAAVANTVTVSVLGLQVANTASIDNSFTKQEEVQFVSLQHRHVTLAYKLNTGTVNPTWSWGSASLMAASIASFKDPTSPGCSGSGTVWTCTSGSSSASVAAAVAAADDGATIAFAAGSHTWTSRIGFSLSKGVTLLCATTPPATSPWGGATSGGCDVTISGSGGLGISAWNTTATNTKLYRISGFNFVNAPTTLIWWGYGCGCTGHYDFTSVRIDHNRFIVSGTDPTLMVFGDAIGSSSHIWGLVDHNYATKADTFGFAVMWSTGDTPTAHSGQRGTANNMFFEDNVITMTTMTNDGRGVMDGWGGHSWVFRNNTVTNSLLIAHGVTHGWGPTNVEVYNNSLGVDVGVAGFNSGLYSGGYRLFHHQGSGEIIAFNNSFTPYSGHTATAISVTHYRSASTADSGAGSRCDGNAGIDGNRSPAGTYYGYPCKRQPGRNINAVLQPMYAWNNYFSDTLARLPMVIENPWTGPPYPTTHIVAERDYYNSVSKDAQTSADSCGAACAPFDGSTGMGFGTLLKRPTTCTTTTEAADAGNGGVGYFATDQGSWNLTGADGLLYRCSATNTWTLHYTPYTYPHPLQGSLTPAAPIGLHAGFGGGTFATIIWNPSAEANLAGYKIYSCPTNAPCSNLIATYSLAAAAASYSPSTRYTDIRRYTAGTVYYFISAYSSDDYEGPMTASGVASTVTGKQ
jgi:hypothetical protein